MRRRKKQNRGRASLSKGGREGGERLSETLIQTTSGRRRRRSREDDQEEEEVKRKMVMVCSSAWFSVVLPFSAIVRMQTHRHFSMSLYLCLSCPVSLCNYQCRKKCRAKTDETGIAGKRQRAQDSPNQGGVKSVIPRHSNQTGVTVCVLYLRRHPSKDRERLDRKEDGPFVDHRPRADMQ